MEKVSKAPNYTPEQEAQLREAYEAGTDTAKIAEILGKSVRSVTAKLVRMGVYKKKEYVSKNGEKPIKKQELLDKLGELMPELTANEVDSLAGANKTALQKLVEYCEAMQAKT